MRTDFCVHYKGNGIPPTNRYCRQCPVAHHGCDRLWGMVVNLSQSSGGQPVGLPGTRAVLEPNPGNPQLVRVRIKARRSLGKEDFLYFIATGNARRGKKDQRQDPLVSPSMTLQEPYIRAIIGAIGGEGIPEIATVRSIQSTAKVIWGFVFR